MRNIVLTGFMGTGKTAVGREVARRLSCRFVDMDAEIEARAGKSIPDIFAEDGEGVYRQMEAMLRAQLSARQDLVIATGGGALVDPACQALMMKESTTVCLTCDTDNILRRVSNGTAAERPLLGIDNPRAAIERLLDSRAEAYGAIPWRIDTSNLSIDEVAARVVEIAAVIILPVHSSGGGYEVHIGNGLLAHIGGVLRAGGMGGRVALVSNPVVAPLYAGRVEESLRAAGLQPFTCSIPDGEQHKSLATVEDLYAQFLNGGLDRSGTVLALGGGVTGDLAGFAAATFMRGIRLVQVPTTLLAMVDAGVGGKTGVDLPQGKNLVGAFHQPAVVMIDPSVLSTLPPEEIRCGLAETIKHGIIGDADLFAELEAGGGALPPLWEAEGVARIARALRVKIDIVENDPFEEGSRALLNLGHTVGHALERLSGFELRHGEAVSIGMVAEARIAAELGRADHALPDRIEAALAAWGLPVRSPPFGAAAVWEAMEHDKKRCGRSLRFALPCAVGRVEIVEDIPPVLVKSVLCNMGDRRM